MFVAFTLKTRPSTVKTERPTRKAEPVKQTGVFSIIDVLPMDAVANTRIDHKNFGDESNGENGIEFDYYFDCGDADVDSIRKALHMCFSIPESALKNEIESLRRITRNETDYSFVLLFKSKLAEAVKEQKPVPAFVFGDEEKAGFASTPLSLFKRDAPDNESKSLDDTLVQSLDFPELYKHYALPVENTMDLKHESLLKLLPVVSAAKRKEIIKVLLTPYLPSRYADGQYDSRATPVAMPELGFDHMAVNYEDRSQFARIHSYRSFGSGRESIFIAVAPYLTDQQKLYFIEGTLKLKKLSNSARDLLLGFSSFKEANRPAILNRMLDRVLAESINNVAPRGQEKETLKALLVETGRQQELFDIIAKRSFISPKEYDTDLNDWQKIASELNATRGKYKPDVQRFVSLSYTYRIHPGLLSDAQQVEIIRTLFEALQQENLDKQKRRWLFDDIRQFKDEITRRHLSNDFIPELKKALDHCDDYYKHTVARLLKQFMATYPATKSFWFELAEIAKKREEYSLLIACAKKMADAEFTQSTVIHIVKRLEKTNPVSDNGHHDGYFTLMDQLRDLSPALTPSAAATLNTVFNRISRDASSPEKWPLHKDDVGKLAYYDYQNTLQNIIEHANELEDTLKSRIANEILDDRLPLVNTKGYGASRCEEMDKYIDCLPVLSVERISVFIDRLTSELTSRLLTTGKTHNPAMHVVNTLEDLDKENQYDSERNVLQEDTLKMCPALEAALQQLVTLNEFDNVKNYLYGTLSVLTRNKAIDESYRLLLVDVLVNTHIELKQKVERLESKIEHPERRMSM